MNEKKILLFASLIFLFVHSSKTQGVQILQKKVNDSSVAVIVNGAKIYEDKVLKIAKYREEEAKRSDPNFNLIQARKVVIQEMILTELILQKGKEKHIPISDKEVKDIVSRSEGIPYDELKKDDNYKGDFSEFQRGIKASSIIYPKLLMKEYAGRLKPSEEQMRTYYNQHIGEYRHQEPEKYRLKIIQFWFDEDTNNPYQTEALAKADAQKVLQKLQNGEDFDTLDNAEEKAHVQRVLKKYEMEQPQSETEEHLKDGTNNILLSKEGLARRYSPEFRNVVLSLKPGQIGGIIKTNNCFNIVKFIEQIDEGKAITQSFEEVKEKIRKYVTNELQEKAFYEYVQKLLSEADIKFTNKEDDWRLLGESNPKY